MDLFSVGQPVFRAEATKIAYFDGSRIGVLLSTKLSLSDRSYSTFFWDIRGSPPKIFTVLAPVDRVLPPFFDLHEDISLYYVMGGYGLEFEVEDFSRDIPGSHGDLVKFKKANVKLVFSSIAPLFPTLDKYRTEQLSAGYGHRTALRIRGATLVSLEHLKTYINLFSRFKSEMKNVLTTDDVSRLPYESKIGFLLALEGAEALDDVEDLELFFRLGLRSLQLTWNFDTKYSATCMSKKDYGLTGDGERLVELCNDLGVIVDLSHGSKKALLETSEVSKLPFIVSHANAMGVQKHPRNLDDSELEAVRRVKGVVGFTFIPPTISSKPSLKGLADHIMYVYKSFGAEIAAIGTDYFGLLNTKAPEGLENITKIPNLWSELAARGLGEADLEKIAYQNALRVIKENAKRWAS